MKVELEMANRFLPEVILKNGKKKKETKNMGQGLRHAMSFSTFSLRYEKGNFKLPVGNKFKWAINSDAGDRNEIQL